MLRLMPAQLQITIDLELTRPVSGSLAVAGEPAATFSGWLELHSALELICACAELPRNRDEEEPVRCP
jgi:hypothetical protein